MNKLTMGIDLSTTSAGVCIGDKFELIQIKGLDDENLINAIAEEIIEIIKETKPDTINLEGLSLGSLSSRKDFIAGNFWHLRCEIKKNFPSLPINIIPVKTWRCPLFSKEENKLTLAANKIMKAAKKQLKGLKGNARKEVAKTIEGYENAKLQSDIKYQTFLKLPEDVKIQIINICGETDSRWDLTDAYFISRHKV